MRVLVVDPDPRERESTARLLSASDQLQLFTANDASAALVMMGKNDVDVLVVEMHMPQTTGVELVRRLRAQESDSHLYVVMTSVKNLHGDLKIAFEAGADDYLKRPFSRDELLLRVGGLERIKRWASRVHVTAPPAATQVGGASWQRIDQVVACDVGDMLGSESEILSDDPPASVVAVVSEIALSSPDEEAEIRVRVGLDVNETPALGKALLDDESIDAAAARDILREVANTAGGAFRRALDGEGLEYTLGLPQDVGVSQVQGAGANDVLGYKQWRVRLHGGAITFHFCASLRGRSISRCHVDQLREGMVLASDVLNVKGVVLLAKGTRLTQSHLERLPQTLGSKAVVDVVEAA